MENNKIVTNNLFVFTVFYFISIALFLFLCESFVNTKMWLSFWHFISNIVNYLVLATTIFLITLNNPIRNLKSSVGLKKLTYNVFNLSAVVLTIVSPWAVTNSDSMSSLQYLWVHHMQHIRFHGNFFEILATLAATFVFSILFISAKMFSTNDQSDDEDVEKIVEQIENTLLSTSEKAALANKNVLSFKKDK